jgi:hypothetical protein
MNIFCHKTFKNACINDHFNWTENRIPVSNIKNQGGNSQNFLGKFVRFCVSVGPKILRLFRFIVLF